MSETTEFRLGDVLKYLRGGIVVVRREKSGKYIPEFFSDDFLEIVKMSKEEVWDICKEDIMAGVHPEDRSYVEKNLLFCIENNKSQYELQYRICTGDRKYIWINTMSSLICDENGIFRIYISCHDISMEKDKQERLFFQYKEQLYKQYIRYDKNILTLGHCNLSKDRMLEVVDYTDSKLLRKFGYKREKFFAGIGSFIVKEEERQEFYKKFSNEGLFQVFQEGIHEMVFSCFVKLSEADQGRYVKVKVNMIEAPVTGDIMGILTILDITDDIIQDKIFKQLSAINYEAVIDTDFEKDTFRVLKRKNINGENSGSRIKKVAEFLNQHIIQKDRKRVAELLDTEYILRRLAKENMYSFSYEEVGENGLLMTKKITIFAVDLHLKRIAFAITDITESIREQRALLNTVAYTFETVCFIDTKTKGMTAYTRDIILQNRVPYFFENCEREIFHKVLYLEGYEIQTNLEILEQFCLKHMIENLENSPNGYARVIHYKKEDTMVSKKISVLWGNDIHDQICIVRADITKIITKERRVKEELEEALKQAEKADKAKSQFLSSMSHDIRTPLNAIMGLTTLALQNKENCRKMEECLKKINVSSSHLLSLINDILDMSQLKNSDIHLNCDCVSMNTIIDQIIDIVQPQAEEANLEFCVHRENLTTVGILGDALRIKQILINLLNNSIKFTPEGGRVDFFVKEIKAKRKDHAKYFFKVKDTGIGIEEKFKDQLFEPFARSERTSRVTGTGLGLSIVKKLVELMDGKIQVESELYRGTSFSVELEFKKEEKHTSDSTENFMKEQEGLNGLHFLIVEDNMINYEILGELLEMQGASFTVKCDGQQAVEEFARSEKGEYDAILMDIQMPVMNGCEAAKKIRSLNHPDALTIPILAMSANAFKEDVNYSLAHGMNGHIPKPIDMKILADKILDSIHNK